MYDREQMFKKEIAKKAEELNRLCKMNGVISFMSFCIKDDDKETTYKNYMNGSRSSGIRLTDDRIRHHINVANGFNTIPPREDVGIDDILNEIEEG